MAEVIAAQEGITLAVEHWEVVRLCARVLP
ncbi:tRNA 2-thiouridine synthesizing protein E [Klebsiella pneumoniae]|uniref:tRNA 2-thiouridine synthesizing protein E n=1 Tax=Klebsiella pneumoniae TaxID=573 RepID=A0A377TRW5_KLEPN|nr:tRNA 2-thiouridine synthesizing protein E [Klebsiella pneumoniae]